MGEFFEILKAIENKKSDLVKKAESLCEKYKSNIPERSQLQNLKNVAHSTTCIEEIKNYIRYQIGRKEWEKGFGEEIIKLIDTISAELGSDKEKTIRAVRLFIGYLIREERYLKG